MGQPSAASSAASDADEPAGPDAVSARDDAVERATRSNRTAAEGYYYSRRFLSSRGFRRDRAASAGFRASNVAIVNPGTSGNARPLVLGVREGAERAQVHVQRLAPDAIARDDALVREGVRERDAQEPVPAREVEDGPDFFRITRRVLLRRPPLHRGQERVHELERLDGLEEFLHARVPRRGELHRANDGGELGHPRDRVEEVPLRPPSKARGETASGPAGSSASPSSSYASETS